MKFLKLLLLILGLQGWKEGLAQNLAWDTLAITLPEYSYYIGSLQRHPSGWVMDDPVGSQFLICNKEFGHFSRIPVTKHERPVYISGFLFSGSNIFAFLSIKQILCLDIVTGKTSEVSSTIHSQSPGNYYDRLTSFAVQEGGSVTLYYPFGEGLRPKDFRLTSSQFQKRLSETPSFGILKLRKSTNGKWKKIEALRRGQWPGEYAQEPSLVHMEYTHIVLDSLKQRLFVGYAGSPEIQCYSLDGVLLGKWIIPADSMEADDTLHRIPSPVGLEAKRMQYSLESGRYLQLHFHAATQTLFRVYSTGVQDTCPLNANLHDRATIQAGLWENKKWFFQVIDARSDRLVKRKEIRLPHEYTFIDSDDKVIYFSDFKVRGHVLNIYTLPVTAFQ